MLIAVGKNPNTPVPTLRMLAFTLTSAMKHLKLSRDQGLSGTFRAGPDEA